MTSSIYDLDYKSTAALTEEQVRMFIDIEAANKGFPLLPSVSPEPVKPAATPTKAYYGVAGLFFENDKDALEVLRILSTKKIVEIDHNWQQGIDVAKPRASYLDSERELKTKLAFTPEEYDGHKNILESYATAKSRYDREQKAYDTALETRRAVSDSVWGFYRESQQRVQEEAEIVRSFEKYTEMLDGNKEHAARMLRSVIPNMSLELSHHEYVDRLLSAHENVAACAPAEAA